MFTLPCLCRAWCLVKNREFYLILPQDHNFSDHNIRSELRELIINILWMVHNKALFFFGITLSHAVSHAVDKLSFKRMLILPCIFMWEVPSSNFSQATNCSILQIAQNKSGGCDDNAVYSIRKIIVVFSL
jgi:hypothetical protein